MKKILTTAAALLILSAQVHSFAAMRVTYDVNSSSIDIDISGITNEPALVSVIRGKYNEEAAVSADYIYFGELYKDGSVECGISPTEPSGEYTVISSVEGEVETESLWHMNAELAAAAISKLKNADTEEKVDAILKAEYENLGIDIEEYSSFDKDTAAGFLKLFAGTDKSPIDFRNAYYSALAVAKAKQTQSAEEAEKIINKYNNELGLDREEYNELDSAARAEFLRLFRKGNINQSTPSLQTKEYMFLSLINSNQSWSEVRKLIVDDYRDFLKPDLTKFNKCKNGEAIIKELMQKIPFDSAEACVNAFYAAVDNVGITSREETGSSSSGGSSSGGSSGGGYVSPAAPTTRNTEFEDVPQSHWAYDYIKALRERKIINGIDETHYNPEGGITRAEFSTLIVNMFYPDAQPQTAELSDVAPETWYYSPIVILYNNGIIVGDEQKNINPNKGITREDVCVLICRTLKLTDGENAPFEDADQISSYAKGAVARLFEENVISGMGDNRFAPKNGMTRAEVAAVLYRISERG